MKKSLILLAGVLSVIALDALWLGVLMTSFYKEQIGVLSRMKEGGFDPDYGAALVVYLLLSAGLGFFVVFPYQKSSIAETALRGSFFGAVIYGVYEFTNLSLLNGWPMPVVWVDWLWGFILCGLVAGVMKSLERFLYQQPS